MSIPSKELYEFIITVTDDKVKEIKVTREEFDKLEQSMDRLEQALEHLAEAQRKTNEQMERLMETHRQLAIQVGKLSDTVGYTLEDMARTCLPPFLEKKLNVTIGILNKGSRCLVDIIFNQIVSF